MRLILTLLLVALLVFGVWSFIAYEPFLLGPSPNGYSWWWPAEISTFGEDIDVLFVFIAVMVGIAFVLTFAILIVGVWRFTDKREGQSTFTHGSHKLEMLWTAIPALLLLLIAFTQMGTWASIKFEGATEGDEVFAEIYASQFDWRYRYPGPDKRFGTDDDFESTWELVVPRDTRLVFQLRSRDVLHSLFIPMLRVKQDAVPGMTIPVWFEVDGEELDAAFEGQSDNTFDIICAELCGWGHYKMSGRVRVLSTEDYAAWVQEKIAERFSNGEIAMAADDEEDQ